MSREVEAVVSSEEIGQILKEANCENPSKEAIKKLKKVLTDNPELWRQTGDLARITQQQLINKVGKTALLTKSIQHGIAEMRTEFGFKNASSLERLLIEQIHPCLASLLHYTMEP